jgi:hypothetical protein
VVNDSFWTVGTVGAGDDGPAAGAGGDGGDDREHPMTNDKLNSSKRCIRFILAVPGKLFTFLFDRVPVF